jgi:hypothetical protein
LAVAGEREPGREVGLHRAIEQRALGPPPAIERRAVSLSPAAPPSCLRSAPGESGRAVRVAA